MPTGSEPLHLVWALLACAVPVAAGYRFSRRFNPPLAAATDALLLAYLVQYLAIVPAGFLGILTPVTITAMGAGLCAILFLLARRSVPAEPLAPLDRAVILVCVLFAVGYLGAFVYDQRFLPPLATDALAYHLPASVQWLQHRRIDLLPTWFFNPANTYSPLAGSVFITWLSVPLGNDAFARFVQIGPIFLVFLVLLDINLGSLATSALAAVAAVLSRPMLAEGTLPKDDLFVAAFFVFAVANLTRDKLRHPLAPFRLGASVGLLLATKYTAILSAALLLIAADAPFRAGWRLRHWLTFAVVVFLLAGPWYLRNYLLTGNPLFPETIHFGPLHLPGLFSASRSIQLSTFQGFWAAISAGYFALPPILWVILAIVWIVAVIRSGRLLAGNPQRRLILLAPPVGIALFAFLSPYAEVRFILPELALLFAAIPIALCGNPVLQSLAIIPAVVSIATSFAPSHSLDIAIFATVGVVAAILGIALWRIDADSLHLWLGIPRVTAALMVVAFFFALACWTDYLAAYRQTTRADLPIVYGEQGELWSQIDAAAAPDATIAYANQFMIYPLYGFDHGRKALFVPTRPDLQIENLKLPAELSGEQISAAATEAINSAPDGKFWLRNLKSSGAQYLIAGAGAPEISLADANPDEFQPLLRNDAGVIYKISPVH